MKVICASDKFKGSLTAAQAAAAMRRGIDRVLPQITVDQCPMADGGEGFGEAISSALRVDHYIYGCELEVIGPLGARVDSSWFLVSREQGPEIGVIEMSRASGLSLVPPAQRNPMLTTTFGTGELIVEAIRTGCRRVILGIGGSATNDGGCGAAQAAGARFYDASDRLIERPVTGGMLTSISRIDLAPLHDCIAIVEFVVACDVTNPLTGLRGAAHVYGPQKGATPQQVDELDAGLRHLAKLTRAQIGVDMEQVPGAGAAGGMGFGMLAFWGASLRPGIDLVLEALHFDERVRGCDLCITGEGRFDDQSLAGKTCVGVARAAKKHGVLTIAIVGDAGPEIDQAVETGLFADYHVIGRGLPPEESMQRAGELIEAATAKACLEWLARR